MGPGHLIKLQIIKLRSLIIKMFSFRTKILHLSAGIAPGLGSEEENYFVNECLIMESNLRFLVEHVRPLTAELLRLTERCSFFTLERHCPLEKY